MTINQPSPCLKVCYFGTYRGNYSRNQIMIAGLRAAGIEVIECHEVLWHGIDDRVNAASGGWLRPTFIWRVIRTYTKLAWRGLKQNDYDVLMCGYPGQFDIFLAWIFARLRHRPLAWDVFMSIYLIALERGLDKTGRLTVELLKKIEWLALRLPDTLIQDTQDYVNWLARTYKISPKKFRIVPTGADDRVFSPREVSKDTQRFTVVYYGTFIPNHGVAYIIEAARCLRDDPDIQFILIGEGPDLQSCQNLTRQYQLERVTYLPWMHQEELIQYVAKANVCLGAFGNTPQSLMTVQNKVYEGLAMGRTVITGDSPAVRNVLTHGKTGWLCDRNHPESLADAIKTLRDNPTLCEQIGNSGKMLFQAQYSIFQLGRKANAYINEMLPEKRRSQNSGGDSIN